MKPTITAAVLGAADTAVFIARRPRMFQENRGRALGNVAVASTWLALAVSANHDRHRRASRSTRGLATGLAIANAALLAMHVKHRVASPRIFVGAALSGFALADSARAR